MDLVELFKQRTGRTGFYNIMLSVLGQNYFSCKGKGGLTV